MTPLVTEATAFICELNDGGIGKLTYDALPEVVGLTLSSLVARELPIDFIFDVTHRNERSDNTGPTTSFHWETQVRRDRGK